MVRAHALHEREEKWIGNPERKRPLEDIGLDGRMVAKWTMKQYDMRVCTGLIVFRIVVDSCECGGER